VKRIFVVLAALLPAATLVFFTLVPSADLVASLPLFHFYVVTFITFSAAVVSILLAASLGNNAQPRHILAAAAFAVMGSLFFSHGLTTPNALINHVHPALSWSAWLTLFGGGALFAGASLDGPSGLPRWLPVRLIVNIATAGVLIYSAIAAFLPDILTGIQQNVAPWHQLTIFIITLILWAFATLRLGWIWTKTHNAVDAVLAFIAFWMITATVSLHRYPVWNFSWWLYHVILLVGFLITVVVLVRQYEQIRQFQLRRYYLGLSLIITALLALVASALFTQFSYNTVVSQLQTSSVSLANNLANSVARDLPDMATTDDLRRIAQSSGINAVFAVRVTGLPIQSVLVYDDTGLAAYASDPDWVGVNVENRPLFNSALNGTTVAELRPPDDPPATYQPTTQVDVIETYAPIHPSANAQGQPIGVLVTVAEAPEISTATLNARITGLLTAVSTMGLLFLALLTVVNRADTILTHRSAELATAYKNLREAEGMRDDLTNMIMHDLRNPLTAISASLDFVGRFDGEAQAAARARMVNNAQAASDRMMGMIEDLLTVSKIESGQLNLQRQSTNVSELLTEAVSTFTSQAAAEKKTIILNCPPRLMASVDQPLLRRVLENLIGNAFKYTDLGEGKIEVLASQANGRLIMTVRDNGLGVPEEHKHRIFEKFVQLNGGNGLESVRKGAGLGLAFCQLVIRQHGGEITVQDAPSGGSDFVLWLPA